MRVGIDLMGGDQPPGAVFEAVLQVGTELSSKASFVVFTQHSEYSNLRKQYEAYLNTHPSLSIEFVTTETFIEKDDSPLLAVRRKKNSSMVAGIKLLKEKNLSVFVSTGNTGALIATSMFYLPRLEGIERPALLVVLPAGEKGVVVLDVGANISCKPHHLIDYARMGIIYRQLVHKVAQPTVGLLNIGTEQQKGTQTIKEAHQTLQEYFQKKQTPFLGNIEGGEVFQGAVDVLITDGFTGNVFLKTCEGVSSFLINYLADQCTKVENNHELKKLLTNLDQHFNYAEHPGAVVCGVDGLVIKCHGYSDVRALKSGIRGAYQLASSRFIDQMKAHLQA